MAWKRGSYRPAALAPDTTRPLTPEEIAADQAFIAAKMAEGLNFFEAFAALPPRDRKETGI